MNNERHVEIDTLAKIELIKGRSYADMDGLAKILVDNYPTYVLTAIPWELSDK